MIETVAARPRNAPCAPLRAPIALVRIWPWLAATFSGVLLALCFPPFDQGWLVWIALTPLVCALWFSEGRHPSRWRLALLGYLAGVVFFSAVFYWLYTLGVLFRSTALLGLPLLLSPVFGLYFAAWAWFIGRLGEHGADAFRSSRRNLAIGFFAACAWVVQEWVRGWLFSGFGWNGLGVALHRNLPMIQAADLAGVLGLSWLVAFCNVMAVVVVRRIVADLGMHFMKRIRWEFSATMALIAGFFAYGVHALLRPLPERPLQLKVAMIQPNVPQEEKWSADSEDELFQRFDVLTRAAALSKPDLVVWPEAVVPRGMFADDVNFKFVLGELDHGAYSLLLGTILSDDAAGADYNGAALVSSKGRQIQLYRKMHLVPFGEYLPFRPLFGIFAGGLVPGDFTPGVTPNVLTLPSPRVRIGTLICFEDTLGDLCRRFVGNGAQLLVNLTNDGWFLQTAAAEQQFANSVFRAVENRRPLLRCANTGVTGSVDRAGRVKRWAEPFREEAPLARTIEVPSEPTLTFYTRYGDWLAYASCGAILLWSAIRINRPGFRPGKAPSIAPDDAAKIAS